MSIECRNSNGWQPISVQVCSERTLELFNNNLRYLMENYCPNTGQVIDAAAILTMAIVLDLNHAKCFEEQQHE